MLQEVLFIDYVEGVDSMETPIQSKTDLFDVVYDLGYMMESVWVNISDEPFNKEELLEVFAGGLES